MVTCVRSTGWDLTPFPFLSDEREVLLLAFSDSTSALELRLSEAVSSPLLPPSLPCRKAMPGGQDIVLSSILDQEVTSLFKAISGGQTKSSFKPLHPHCTVGVSWVTEGKVESSS